MLEINLISIQLYVHKGTFLLTPWSRVLEKPTVPQYKGIYSV